MTTFVKKRSIETSWPDGWANEFSKLLSELCLVVLTLGKEKYIYLKELSTSSVGGSSSNGAA